MYFHEIKYKKFQFVIPAIGSIFKNYVCRERSLFMCKSKKLKLRIFTVHYK